MNKNINEIKVGFYFNNSKYSDVDFSTPYLGNPGIGGTEHMFSLVSYYLANYTNVYIFTNHIGKLANNTVNIAVNNFEEALLEADKLNIDYLICRSFGNKESYVLTKKYNCKIIIWAHNFTKFKELNWICKCENVIKYICVGKNQQDLLIGHPIYKKSTYIYNGLNLSNYKITNSNKNNSICYIGAVNKNKGFDICCKTWRRLYDSGYDLDFNIIGSAKLYNSKKILGEYGIATPEYEKEFINYITSNGKLIDKVKICGVLGHEDKINVINNSTFGISASQEETFGLVAVEFETLGRPFIAKSNCGFKDTVENGKTGVLVSSDDELYDACVKTINSNENEYKNMSSECIEFSKKFDINLIINDWIDTFNELEFSKETIQNKQRVSFLKRIVNNINLIINKR